MIVRFARILDFPIGFFSGEDIDGPPERAVSFRSLSTMSAMDRRAALAAGSLAFMFSDWIDQKFALPEPALDDFSGFSPEMAARSVRQKWGLGEQPVKNTIHLLEAKGVRVFSMAETTKMIDACSTWRGDRPFVFLNMFKTAERTRFDVAHELGHLVLHRHGGPRGREVEDQANQFAEEFLMPRADVLAIVPRIGTLNQIIQAKRRWGVSAQALTYRLHRLNITSEWQNRTFCIQMVQHGYTDTEPKGIEREQSLIWQKVLTVLWKEKVTKADIASSLNLPQWELENLLFGLSGLGGGNGSPDEPKRTAQLKIVAN